jgi:hypothetical protein
MEHSKEDRLPETAAAKSPRPLRWWRRRWFLVLSSVVLVTGVALVVAAEYMVHHAEPILRKRVVETLAAHFHMHVELDRLTLSLTNGVEVEGGGLRIGRVATHDNPGDAAAAPMVSVRQFRFRTVMRALWHQPTHIATVDVQGMEIHVPPAGQRGDLLGGDDRGGKRRQARIALLVDEIRCTDVKLLIETSKPGKEPLTFDIHSLNLRDVGNGQPFMYTAELVNPKPTGEIHAQGHFGPWKSEDPRETALDGRYSFEHADLNTINGIGGILSSRGQFAGVLDHLTVDGETDTPEFSLDVSEHPVPLHTVFHAYVDGTSGDTYLDPVRARLLQSEFTCRGKVVRVKGKGHDIEMNVDIPHARMQDMLRLGVKTRPPLMNGTLTMKAKLHIPPGPVRVAQKLQLAGTFRLRQVEFNNPQLQDKIDGLSARAQGRPRDVGSVSTDRETQVNSEMQARFTLGSGLMMVNDVHYQIPGALVLLNGVYSMDGNLFEFKGHVRTDATASQMVTGWKHWLLKPVDPFLKKDGAGVQLPISISGTKGDVHFGLALHGTADESSKEMAEDLRRNRDAMVEQAKAKRDAARARREREKAAHAADGERIKAEKRAEKDEAEARRHAAAAAADGEPE